MTLPEAVLLDLGGVLEEVVAAPRVEAWTRGAIPVDEFWSRWLSARSVADFESGRTTPAEFARQAVAELGLAIAPEAFLADFGTWLAGPLPGAAELVADLRATGLLLASFSNSNPVHWPIMERHQGTETAFAANFPSHELGRCKPDPEAFAEVARRLALSPGSILFLDDNEVNCAGARQAGLRATRALGPGGAREALRGAGIRV